ncbi:hypothetical protein [Thiomicrorhabdus sp.]|uniref:hypothetical protein n=1 Tax=Thiomicrorhabdus sp. TaxID=2039724 RepID=UPI0029C65CC4|nr:hypothetical protein [Thiomicrorhabdus sp.]
MMLVKPYVRLDEAVKILQKVEPSISTKKDIVNLVYDGVLEVRVKIQYAELIPADYPFFDIRGFSCFGEDNNLKKWVQALLKWIGEEKRTFAYFEKKEILSEYRKIVKSSRTRIITPSIKDRLDSRFYPILIKDGVELPIRLGLIDYREFITFTNDAKNDFSPSRVPVLSLNTPIYVSPINILSDNPYSFLERSEKHNIQGMKQFRYYSSESDEDIWKGLLSDNVKCSYEGKEYYLVRRYAKNSIFKYSCDHQTIPYAVVNDEVYISSSSIKSLLNNARIALPDNDVKQAFTENSINISTPSSWITVPRKRKDDFYLAMEQVFNTFVIANRRQPEKAEAWEYFKKNLPTHLCLNKKQNAVCIDGKEIDKEAFLKRFKRYTE